MCATFCSTLFLLRNFKGYNIKKIPQQKAESDELRELAYKYIGKEPPKRTMYIIVCG